MILTSCRVAGRSHFHRREITIETEFYYKITIFSLFNTNLDATIFFCFSLGLKNLPFMVIYITTFNALLFVKYTHRIDVNQHRCILKLTNVLRR